MPTSKSRLKNQSVQLTRNSDLEIKREKSPKKKVQYHEEVEIIDPKPSNDLEDALKK